jgi:hypothetical protein
MKKTLRVVLLGFALAGFLVFCSFNIENLGPRQTITVGLNLSPWLKWSRIKGFDDIGQRLEFKPLSWSMAGLAGGLVLLAVRSRVKR